MRIITEKAFYAFAQKHADLAPVIERIVQTLRAADWKNIDQLRSTFPHADHVQVASEKTVIVINVGGNKCRLVTAIHFNRGIFYILAVLTHAEYSRNKGKDIL